MAKLVEVFKSFWRTPVHHRASPPVILNLLFPRKCLGCGRTGNYFCPDCLNSISLKNEGICPMCSRSAVGGLTHSACLRPQGMDGLTSIFSYEGLIKKAIKKIKYRFVSDLAVDLVEAFLSFLGKERAFVNFCLSGEIVLLPIPLHFRRLRWRGFNQAELLGKIIAENLGIRLRAELLLRIKETKPQAELDQKARLKNIRGAFKLNPKFKNLIFDSKFLIFDDVWTSGATLKEAAKVLKRAGAEKIWGLTIAR